MPAFFLALVLWCLSVTGAQAASPVVHLTLKGPITPLAASYVARGIREAETRKAQAVVLQLDTPGGLMESMRELNASILAAPVPVIVWVGPAGARAASAGVFITAAGHIAAMAPSTAIGAASVVGGDGAELGKTLKAKVTNDAVAYLKAIGTERGRNVVWLERAVREAVSLSATEALANKVVDLLAPDIPTLLQRVDGRTIRLTTGSSVLHTANVPVTAVPMTWVEDLLYTLSNPNIAYILLSIGTLALLAEMSQPGMIFPGVFGAICLLLALYALGTLPVNYAGVALVLLGLILLTAEFYVVSFGVLLVGGLIAFTLGSLMLINQEQGIPGVAPSLIVSTVGTLGIFSLLAGRAVYNSMRRPVQTGMEFMIGQTAEVLTSLDPEGIVLVEGERWVARSTAAPVPPRDKVRIIAIHGLRLTVTPIKE
ncbi:MAG: nodulation protein NfeD [Candidatus Sericytochromatia bacterium]|nr:nodulation protein NfeD [Candidatus Sericytochromatia bacterium]